MKKENFIPEFSKSMAIVCHDAGATNLILPLVGKISVEEINLCVKGPAKKLWSNTYPKMKLIDSFEKAIQKTDLLISGTGWSSSLEHDARKFAKENKIYSIAIIDHWANYEERFVRNEEIILPDELWVFDNYAYKKAKEKFPNQIIKLKPNFYLENQLKSIKTQKRVLPEEVLYVLGPVRNDWGRGIRGEFQALDYFVENLYKLNIPKDVTIRLRLHPSELSDKYNDWILNNKSFNLIIDKKRSLTDLIGQATWVAGCESYGLVLALEAKKSVISTLPEWAHKCRLPHEGIIHLRDL